MSSVNRTCSAGRRRAWPWRRRVPSPRGRARLWRPRLEVLEDRTAPAAVTVGNLNDVVNGTTTSIAGLIADPGPDGISLREALEAANNTAGADGITFRAGLNGVLNLSLGQMTISDPVTITGNGAADTI